LKPSALSLLVVLLLLSTTNLAGQSSFDEGDVSAIVRLAKLHGEVWTDRLAKLVNVDGINFDPSESYLEGLRKQGAGKALLKALRSAHKVSQMGQEVRPSSVYGVGSELKRLAQLVPLYNPEPPYTECARRIKFNGIIVLWVVIAPSGDVIDIKGVSDPVCQGLDENAIATVKTWKFKPPRRNGDPVAVHTDVEISYRTL